MRSRIHPGSLVKRIASQCQQKWHQIHNKMRELWYPKGPSFKEEEKIQPLLPAIEAKSSESLKSSQQTVTATQWQLDEKNQKPENKKVTVVEVEFFPNNPYVANVNPSSKVLKYTAEGDDPNLRITHYPPSNRLH